MEYFLRQYKDISYSGEVSKLSLIIKLYEGAIESIKQAITAINNQDHEKKYNFFVKAQKIIEGLQLYLDFEAGGESAINLDNFYKNILQLVHEASIKNDIVTAEKAIDLISILLNEWKNLESTKEV
jgi:flagellar protein FliS